MGSCNKYKYKYSQDGTRFWCFGALLSFLLCTCYDQYIDESSAIYMLALVLSFN